MLRLLAGVIAVKHRAAREQPDLRVLRLERFFQRAQRGDQFVRLLHIKRRSGQFAVQQIPVIPLAVLRHQPAVHQAQPLTVFRHRQLRSARQHQRIVL